MAAARNWRFKGSLADEAHFLSSARCAFLCASVTAFESEELGIAFLRESELSEAIYQYGEINLEIFLAFHARSAIKH